MINQRKKLLSIALFVSVLIISCKEDDDDNFNDTKLDIGNISPTEMVFSLTEKADTSISQNFFYTDPDGAGGADPTRVDTLIFGIDRTISTATFIVKVNFLTNGVLNTEEIRALGTKYSICYRNMDFDHLVVKSKDLDRRGVELGLDMEWIAKQKNTNGTIRVTMNYNQQAKTGTCDTGSNVFEAFIPYRIIEN